MPTFEHPGQGVANSNEPPSHGIQLILLAQSWGPKNGGINAFNTDFAKALGLRLGPNRVVCVTLDATHEEIEDAAESSKVRLLPIAPGKPAFDEHYADAVIRVLRENGIATGANTAWIGHDVHTGPVALKVASLAGHGRSVVIQHMSYRDYIGFRDGIGQKARQKQQRQEDLYRRADLVFGVGPLLRDRLAEIVHDQGKTAHMIVPGLAEDIVPSTAPRPNFRALTMGRLGPADDRIKQGRLAVAAVASAIGKAHEEPAWPDNLKHAEMVLYGIEEPGGAEEQELRGLAREYAGRGVNILPLPFSLDRRQLFSDLTRSDAALMLSWHEGFGLTGWEAIAAEVPLIASRNSGLYQLIKEALGDAGLALFQHLEIRGWDDPEDDENFHEDDLNDVRSCILRLAQDRAKAKTNAKCLREMLHAKGFTWQTTAKAFVEHLLPVSGPVDPPDIERESSGRDNKDRSDDGYKDLHAELTQKGEALMAAALATSSSAQDALVEVLRKTDPAVEFSGDTRAERLAKILLAMPLNAVFDIAHNAREVLRRKGDDSGQQAIARLIRAILPAKHGPAEIAKVRTQGSAALVFLATTHKTITEIIAAGADGRPAVYMLAENEHYPGGSGLVGHHDGLLETGRDAEAKQFERDVMELILKSLDGLIGSRWRERYRESFPAGWEALDGYRKTRDWRTFTENVNFLVKRIAEERARELRYEFRDAECRFSFYCLIGTPEDLDEDQLESQAGALRRVKEQWFPSLVFLRLEKLTDANRSELNAYEDLHDLIYPAEKSTP